MPPGLKAWLAGTHCYIFKREVRGQPGTGSWLHGAVLSLLVASVAHPQQTYPLWNPPNLQRFIQTASRSVQPASMC